MPEWNTRDRGQNRADEDSYFEDNTDWDGKSCADFWQLPGRGPVDENPLVSHDGD